jgi:phosphocarrier protein HPr
VTKPDAAQQVAIVNERGLHARAAAKFVKLAGQFDAEATVGFQGTVVSALSIMGLLMLAAGRGSTIEIQARGREAGAAVTALAGLVADGFGER